MTGARPGSAEPPLDAWAATRGGPAAIRATPLLVVTPDLMVRRQEQRHREAGGVDSALPRVHHLDEVEEGGAAKAERLDQFRQEGSLGVMLHRSGWTVSADEHVMQHGEAMRGAVAQRPFRLQVAALHQVFPHLAQRDQRLVASLNLRRDCRTERSVLLPPEIQEIDTLR